LKEDRRREEEMWMEKQDEGIIEDRNRKKNTMIKNKQKNDNGKSRMMEKYSKRFFQRCIVRIMQEKHED